MQAPVDLGRLDSHCGASPTPQVAASCENTLVACENCTLNVRRCLERMRVKTCLRSGKKTFKFSQNRRV